MFQDAKSEQARARHTKRRLAAALLSVAVAAVGVVTAAPAGAVDRPCPVMPYGLIGERWAAEGGYFGFGCPWEPREREVYDRDGRWIGRAMSFPRGEIAWSPNQGITVSLRLEHTPEGSNLVFTWGRSSRSYDKFQVQWHRNGAYIRGEEGPASHTQSVVRIHAPGRYTAVVQGCKNPRKLFGTSACDGFARAIPVSVNVP